MDKMNHAQITKLFLITLKQGDDGKTKQKMETGTNVPCFDIIENINIKTKALE